MEQLTPLLYLFATETDGAKKREIINTLSKLGTFLYHSLDLQTLLNSLLQVLTIQVHNEADSDFFFN